VTYESLSKQMSQVTCSANFGPC